jgi:hypothetical protein
VRLEGEVAQAPPDGGLRSPVRSAIFARHQWVVFFGVGSSVANTTSWPWSTLIAGGRPGRGSSLSPSGRWSTNRPRHLLTVFAEHPPSGHGV